MAIQKLSPLELIQMSKVGDEDKTMVIRTYDLSLRQKGQQKLVVFLRVGRKEDRRDDSVALRSTHSPRTLTT